MRVHWSFLLSILTLAVLFSETPTVALAETEVEGQDGEEDPDDADELFADSPDDLDDEGEDDEDDDDEDLGESPIEKAKREEEEANAVDQDLTPTQRKDRMSACLSVARIHFNRHEADLKDTIDQIMNQHGVQADQAMQFIQMGMIRNCYFYITPELMRDYQSSPAKFLEDDAKITAMLNTETSSGPSGQMSSEQYGLLEEILRGEASSGGAVGLPGDSMTSLQKAVYMLGVFAAFFGIAAYATKRLIQQEEGPSKKKSHTSKSLKHEKKMEARAAKKTKAN
ncbi:hypothetical protein Pmar_PMAR021082 [Perkinsus marinus ATCC 50983]|uniref:Transmembrane protein n=1 Tax=Perkinsus marinus (strain ATCC 50983 / TXsc) TaxID=423536 RepID=C5KGC8_PERM5|nr:hypothetical protein Pmar_PMAR021082 [Perkinsus marinus ATCC 50983]EER16484.1 hypothetical protein Pmar_PMAR021082 [Perkinsus marinus ATCC 50983]|eukprot:XP_002784688.1 hypothetical protein Pmar_PMAR021082 [Perkinsus marinus ATCC 50983]